MPRRMISPHALGRVPWMWLRRLVFRWSAWRHIRSLSDEELAAERAIVRQFLDSRQLHD